jgi:hypothetical protein
MSHDIGVEFAAVWSEIADVGAKNGCFRKRALLAEPRRLKRLPWDRLTVNGAFGAERGYGRPSCARGCGSGAHERAPGMKKPGGPPNPPG